MAYMHRFAAALLLLAACASQPARDYTPAIDASREQVVALIAKEKIPTAAVAVTVGDRMVVARHIRRFLTNLGFARFNEKDAAEIARRFVD